MIWNSPASCHLPIAEGVQNGSTSSIERLRHDIVAVERELRGAGLALVKAIVIFQIVHVVLREELGILCLMSQGARIFRTCEDASRRIHAELQTCIKALVSSYVSVW